MCLDIKPYRRDVLRRRWLAARARAIVATGKFWMRAAQKMKNDTAWNELPAKSCNNWSSVSRTLGRKNCSSSKSAIPNCSIKLSSLSSNRVLVLLPHDQITYFIIKNLPKYQAIVNLRIKTRKPESLAAHLHTLQSGTEFDLLADSTVVSSASSRMSRISHAVQERLRSAPRVF